LDNIVRRAIIFMKYNETFIDAEHIFEFSKPTSDVESTINFPSEGSLSQRIEEYEKWIIEKTLEKNKGNKTKSAKELGLSIRNLYYKLEKYNLANYGMK
jgi:transcriptional regulator with PAS, ATPase and Fis domain